MNRFDCPYCGKSLSFRLLPHVPRNDERFAFSCIHCGTLLEYTKDHLPLVEPFLRTRLRAIITLIGGMIFFSAINLLAGRVASLAVIGILVCILIGVYIFSKRPAYQVLVTDANQPCRVNREQ